jgi:hypothetical protein
MSAYWTTRAAEVVAADSSAATDPWRDMLRRYLYRTQPEQANAMAQAGQLEAYLTVRAADARELEEMLEDSMGGVENAPMIAQSIALGELMPPAGDDAERPIPEDLEEADAAMSDAAEKFLTSNRNQLPK